MIRSFAVALVTILVVSVVSATGEIAAQPQNPTAPPSQLPIQFTGGAPGMNLELYLNAGKVADVTIGATGGGTSVLDLSNLGKVQLQVYVDVCQDGKVVKVMVVAGQAPPEDKNCRRRIAGGAFWSDCGVTRITLDLTKFGMRVIGCGSLLTEPKFYGPVGGAIVVGGLLLSGGGDGTSTTSTTPTPPTSTAPPVTTPPVTTPPVTTPPVTTPPVTTPPTNTTPNTPVDFNVNLTTSYNHPGGNTSLACGLIATTPALNQTASYTGQIMGPGVVSGGSFSGSLNAAGRAVFQAVINAFGTYSFSVSVTSGGQTRTATGSTNVGAANSTCPQP
jgi:hypothetical protein